MKFARLFSRERHEKKGERRDKEGKVERPLGWVRGGGENRQVLPFLLLSSIAE